MCQMPWVNTETKAVILLHQRCRERGVLPDAGGVLDQSEVMMSYFDRIDHATHEYRMNEKQRIESEMKGRAIMEKLGG